MASLLMLRRVAVWLAFLTISSKLFFWHSVHPCSFSLYPTGVGLAGVNLSVAFDLKAPLVHQPVFFSRSTRRSLVLRLSISALLAISRPILVRSGSLVAFVFAL